MIAHIKTIASFAVVILALYLNTELWMNFDWFQADNEPYIIKSIGAVFLTLISLFFGFIIFIIYGSVHESFKKESSV